MRMTPHCLLFVASCVLASCITKPPPRPPPPTLGTVYFDYPPEKATDKLRMTSLDPRPAGRPSRQLARDIKALDVASAVSLPPNL